MKLRLLLLNESPDQAMKDFVFSSSITILNRPFNEKTFTCSFFWFVMSKKI